MEKRVHNYIFWVAGVLPCLLLLFLGSCSPARIEDSIVCDRDDSSLYSDIIARALPSYSLTAKQGVRTAFSYLQAGYGVEAYDAQALSALESGVAGYWYPHYLATAVIAVDRDRTDISIDSWSDLAAVSETVAYAEHYPDEREHLLMAAIAYGLEGDRFTLQKAAALLEALYSEKRLVLQTLDAPIVICCDYQAAALIRSGRNMEVIVPSEGTLTYQKGLLSMGGLRFTEDLDPLLLTAGFRLLDGRCDDRLYPAAAAYGNAVEITDYAHFSSALQDGERIFQRQVLHTRHYTSADGREHQLFVFGYIILLVVWTASFMRRLMQKGALRGALAIGIILLGWIAVRLIKYQLIKAGVLTRYLWYSYYFFQLALPLALLWLAWVIDQPEDRLKMPGWLRLSTAINGILAALVFTNDLHHWVFRFDLQNPHWPTEYSYGIVFFFVAAVWTAQLVAVAVILLIKSRRNLRKKGLLLPLAFCVLLTLYTIGYLTRVPIAFESDYTMITGLFTLLFVEVFMRTGLVPVNTKYAPLFAHSPLKMQITDRNGTVVYSSAAAMQIEEALCQRALESYPLPLEKDGDTLLFATDLVGGCGLWQEDISNLNRLHGEAAESVRRLTAANELLAEEEKVSEALAEERAKLQLMVQLEKVIAPHLQRLSAMIEHLAAAQDQLAEVAPIALLLSYLKRRSNLFFREQETGALPADELTACFDELAGVADYAGVKIAFAGEITGTVVARWATLLYDLYYAVTDWASRRDSPYMLAYLGSDKGTVTLRLLPSGDARSFELKKGLADAIAAAGGAYLSKDLDGATGISLSFSAQGGEAHG